MLTSAPESPTASVPPATEGSTPDTLPAERNATAPASVPAAAVDSATTRRASGSNIPKAVKRLTAPASLRPTASTTRKASPSPSTSSSASRKASLSPPSFRRMSAQTAAPTAVRPTSAAPRASITSFSRRTSSLTTTATKSVSAPSIAPRSGRLSLGTAKAPAAPASHTTSGNGTVGKSLVGVSTSAKARTPVKSADRPLETLIAQLKQQVLDLEQEICTKDSLISEKEEALRALKDTVGGADSQGDAAADELRSQVAELQAMVTSLRGQLAAVREENGALEDHVDKLNSRIIAVSEKHQREIVEFQAAIAVGKAFEKENVDLAAKLASARDERDALAERLTVLDAISETLDATRAEKAETEEALEAVNRQFADLSVANDKYREEERAALREAEATVEELKAQLAQLTIARVEPRDEDLASEVQELRKANTALVEDLRLSEQERSASEAEHLTQSQILTAARDAAENAAAALRAEVLKLQTELERATDAAGSATTNLMVEIAELKAELELAKAPAALDEAPKLRSEASLLGSPPEDDAQPGLPAEDLSEMLRKVTDELESVRAEKTLLLAQVEEASARFAAAVENHERQAAEADAAARREAEAVGKRVELLQTENATLAAGIEALKEKACNAESERPAQSEAGGPLQAWSAADSTAELELLNARVSELTAELDRRAEVDAKVQAAEAALAEAMEAQANEARRAADIEKRLKRREEKVKNLEAAMAKMKPPAPPFTDSDTERFLKRDLERKNSIILELQNRCAEAERAAARKEAQPVTADMLGIVEDTRNWPVAGEGSVQKDLELKDVVIAELNTKVERVMRVHAEDVHSVQSKCRREIEGERQRCKDAIDAAQKENDILLKLVQQLQNEVFEKEQLVRDTMQQQQKQKHHSGFPRD